MSVYTWSQTAATNATADATINWAEGQAPATVNDSARAMMAALAKFRDDISASIVTGGTSTAYTVTSNSNFDTLAHLNGQIIAFTPNATCGATVTLNVDSLGAKPLRSAPSIELPAGALISGTPYVAVYNNSDGAFYLQNAGGAAAIPLGCGMDYWGGTTLPSSNYAFPTGQAISRTTYAALFALMGTTYGIGDGSSTFNLPDKTGRVSAMKEASATRLTSSWFGGNSTVLGATGGAEKNALSATNQLPQFTPSGTISVTQNAAQLLTNTTITPSGAQTMGTPNSATISATFTGNAVGSASPSSFTTTQPTIICNYIIRVL